MSSAKIQASRNAGPAIVGGSAIILGTRVDRTSYAQTSEEILQAARSGQHAYVCVANVHMVMEAYDDANFRRIVNAASVVTPDGMPLVWSLRLVTGEKAERVYGPTLTSMLCERAAQRGIPVGFYGGSEEVLKEMTATLKALYPTLEIAYAFSPPFRDLSSEEDKHVVKEIRASGTKILFVGIGCPKQEKWMASHYKGISSVMVGVGAAFDFIAGAKAQAPSWMQRAGLEWFFRLATEPRRLWARYFFHNPRFIWLITRQLINGRFVEEQS